MLKSRYRLVQQQPALLEEQKHQSFVDGQLAQISATANALGQMAVRASLKDAALAQLVRELQDLAPKRAEAGAELQAAISRPAEARDNRVDAELRQKLSDIEKRQSEIEGRLAKGFPDYAALVKPAPLSIAEVQAQLDPDEALVATLDMPKAEPTPEETFIWVVTKKDARWVRSDLGTEALTREVQALRCGLDDTAWENKPCADLTGRTYTDADRNAGKPLPSDSCARI